MCFYSSDKIIWPFVPFCSRLLNVFFFFSFIAISLLKNYLKMTCSFKGHHGLLTRFTFKQLKSLCQETRYCKAMKDRTEAQIGCWLHPVLKRWTSVCLSSFHWLCGIHSPSSSSCLSCFSSPGLSPLLACEENTDMTCVWSPASNACFGWLVYRYRPAFTECQHRLPQQLCIFELFVFIDFPKNAAATGSEMCQGNSWHLL